MITVSIESRSFWTLRQRDLIITSMKRLLVFAVSLVLLVAATGQVRARYDCRVTGIQNQPSCCCRGESGRDAAISNCASMKPDGACGCCDIKYYDGRVEATKEHAPGAELRTTLADGAPTAVLSSVTTPTLTPGGPISRDDSPEPRSVGPGRYILFCSFLC
jgi:hypothetical protein